MDNLKQNYEAIWKEVKENLSQELPPHAYSTWFEPILPIAINDTELVLEVPNQFFFEWIESHYSGIIEYKVKEKLKKDFSVKYTIAPAGTNEQKINFENIDNNQSKKSRRF